VAFSTLEEIKTALAIAQRREFLKNSLTAEAAGTHQSLWKAAGWPAAGANPTNGAGLNGSIPTKATLGAIPFTNPSGGALQHLLHLALSGTVQGKLILYDRLWHNSGMSGTQTTVDTSLSTPPDLTRPDANGAGTEVWGEIYTAIGTGSNTLNFKYTNQAGTTNRTGFYVNTTGWLDTAGQMFPMTLQNGDTGVRKCTAYHWSTSTGTAGNFGFVILRRIVEIPLPITDKVGIFEFMRLGLPRVYDDACLALMLQCTGTSTGFMTGRLDLGVAP
jgi:hypothetical protein